MQRKITIVMVIILLFLTLTSCKSETADNALKQSSNLNYRAVELFRNIELDGLYNALPLPNGNYLVYGYKDISKELTERESEVNFEYLIVDENGNTIRKLDINSQMVTNMTLGTNDKIVFGGIYDNLNEKKRYMALEFYNFEGELLNKEHKEIDEKTEYYFKKIRVNGQGLIYALTNKGEILVLDDYCNIISRIKGTESIIVDFDIMTENKIVFVEHNRHLVKYDTNENKMIERIELDSDLLINNLNYNEVKGLIYVTDKNNYLTAVREDGKVVEKHFFDYVLNTTIAEFVNIYDINGITYLHGLNISKNKVFYKLLELDDNDKNDTTESNELVFAVLDGQIDETLSHALQVFKSINPDIKVRVIEAGDLSTEQFHQKINTEMLAGKGPDVFLGSFPFDAYMKQNLLVDLQEFIQQDQNFNKEDYLESIVELVKFNDKQFVIPINFNFSRLYVNTQILEQHGLTIDDDKWTVEELIKIIEEVASKNQSHYILPDYGAEELGVSIIKSNMDSFLNVESQRERFDTKEFTKLIQSIQSIRDYEAPSNSELSNILFIPYPYGNYNYKLYLESRVDDINDYRLIKMPKWNQDSKNRFEATLIGINANSQLKDEGWELVRYFISEGYGIKLGDSGTFSINNEANKWMEELYIKGSNEPKTDEHRLFDVQTTNIRSDDLKVSVEEVDKINRLIKGLNYYSFLRLPIYEDLNKFFNSQQDIDQTIRSIENKLELFLGE